MIKGFIVVGVLLAALPFLSKANDRLIQNACSIKCHDLGRVQGLKQNVISACILGCVKDAELCKQGIIKENLLDRINSVWVQEKDIPSFEENGYVCDRSQRKSLYIKCTRY